MRVFILMFGWPWGLAVWIFHGVAYVLLNSSINSICHMVGYRNYDNLATNHQLIALLTAARDCTTTTTNIRRPRNSRSRLGRSIRLGR